MSLEKLSSPNGFQAGWSVEETCPGTDGGAKAGATAGVGVVGGGPLAWAGWYTLC